MSVVTSRRTMTKLRAVGTAGASHCKPGITLEPPSCLETIPSIETATVNRRNLILCAGAIASAAAAFPAPAISQGIREFKMATSWPKGLPGLGSSAERIGQAITAATGNRIQVTVFGAGEIVKPFEVFDAVSSGVVDMYHSAEYYWERRSPGFNFFAAVPFGFTANEMAAWVHFGGGQALWDELSANYNIKPLLSTNTGVQMGGWFTKEVNSPESYTGLKYRMPGLGGEVLRRLGAVVVNLPGGEIIPALRSGAIDASEWVGPWNDMVLGLHKASKFYYYPGFHEPGTVLATGINRARWDSLTSEDRNLITTVANAEYTHSLAEFNANNAKALQELRQDKNVEIRKFDDSVLLAFGKASGEVMAEVGTKDPLSRRIYQSYIEFRSRYMPWSDMGERAYLTARSLPFPYGGQG
jgi:TRAP-type mannitol/chloroaromatic compound transport system substrate-binding protein